MQQLQQHRACKINSQPEPNKLDKSTKQIQIITKDGKVLIARLDESTAANEFYRQLPLTIKVSDYAGSEKIFYLPQRLNTANTPLAQGAAGTIAYYAPWGNVALFYGKCDGASGLYALGEVVEGIEHLASMSGSVEIKVQ